MSLRWIPVVAALLLGGCAQSSTPISTEARQIAMRTGLCFRGEEVNNTNVRGEYAYVATRRGYVYRLDGGEDCFKNGVTSISMPKHRLSNYGICVGDRTAVGVAGWRGGGAKVCVATVSGPIRDSRVSGLWSRQS